jgi:phage-related protein
MPQTTVYFYQELDGRAPVLEWLDELGHSDRKALAECLARIRLLAASGHELRRPHADYLEEGIHELRAKRGHVQYRVLYFFHGRNIALLAHALTKEREIPKQDIKRAVERRKRYEQDPKRHQSTHPIPDTPNV